MSEEIASKQAYLERLEREQTLSERELDLMNQVERLRLQTQKQAKLIEQLEQIHEGT